MAIVKTGMCAFLMAIQSAPKPPYPAPPPEHPRLLARTADLQGILDRRTQGDNATAWNRIIALSSLSNDDLVAGLTVCNSSSYDSTPALAARAKALRYLLDDETGMGDQAVDLAYRLLEEQVFLDGNGVFRSIGKLIYAAACVYDWCHDRMDAGQRLFFIDKFQSLAGQMEIGYPPVRQGAVTGHGSEAQLLRDLLSAAIAVYDEHPAMYEMAAGRFFAEFVEPRNFFYPSGRHHQGNSYFHLRFGPEMFSAWLFRRMAGIDVYDPAQGDVPYVMLYTRRPDGRLLRDGDSSQTANYWRYRYPLFLATAYYADPYMRDEMVRQGMNPLIDDEPDLVVLLNDPELTPRPQGELPTTRFRDGPLASMQCRTGWDADSVVTDLVGAGYQFNNHDHLDAGAFQIYYKGALAHDPGVYGGNYGSDYDMGFNKRSISHNVLLVYDPDEPFARGGNDGGQRFPNEAAEPKTLAELLDPDNGYRTGEVSAHAFGPDAHAPAYSYMKVDLAAAYSSKIETYTRSFSFLNLANGTNPAALVVLDRVKSSNPAFAKHWLLHTVEEPSIANGVVDVMRTAPPYGGRMVVSTLLPEQVEIDVYGGTGLDIDVFGRTLVQPFEREESPGWRVHVKPVVAHADDLFLHVLQVMDAAGAEPLPVERLDGGEWVGARIGSRLVLFSRSDGPMATGIELQLDGPLDVLVADLQPGTWELIRSGQAIPTPVTIGADGTGFFMLDAGTWILQPE